MALQTVSESLPTDIIDIKPQSQVTCRRCSRPLKAPKSVAAGIGPICAGTVAFETRAVNQRGQTYSQKTLHYFMTPDPEIIPSIPVITGSNATNDADEYWTKQPELLKTQKTRVQSKTQKVSLYLLD